MKFFQSFLAFVIGLLIVFFNVKKIPTGYEMGAIGVMFIALIVYLIIFVFYVLISLLLWKKKSKYQSIIQIPLLLLFLTLSYLSSWRICVFQKPIPTEKDQMAEQIEKYTAYKEYYYTIPTIIKNGQTFRPSKKKVFNDSLLILNSIKDLLNIKVNNLDSISKLKLTGLFYNNSTILLRNNKDSIDLTKHHNLINQTLKIRNLFYSPDYKKILIFISYKENKDNKIKLDFSGSGNSFVLMAIKSGGKIILFNYYNIDYSYGFLKNDNIAYSYCFKNLIGDGDQGVYGFKDNFLSSEYWNYLNMTKKVNFKGQWNYKLQFEDKHGQKFIFEKPIYTLKT